MPHHPADVVVCDASVGNVVMKFFEGLSTVIFEMLRKEFQRPPWGPIGYLFMRPGIGRIRARFDYEKLGGAPLLGVNGTVLITHGRARRRMIGYAVEVTALAARARIPERITATLVSEGADRSTALRTDGGPAPGVGALGCGVRGRHPGVRGGWRRHGHAHGRAGRGCRECLMGSPMVDLRREPGGRPARLRAPARCPRAGARGSPARPGRGLRGRLRAAHGDRRPGAAAGGGGHRSTGRRPRSPARRDRGRRIATASTPGSRPWRPPIRSSSWPASTARCCVAAWVNCYTARRRRPGWPSPSGSSSLAPTAESRPGGS